MSVTPPRGVKSFFEEVLQGFHNLRLWDQLSSRYHVFKPPAIPSPNDQLHYQQYIDRLEVGARVVVLGATPRIRELFRNNSNLEIYVADLSKAMYRAMNKLLSPEVVRGEKYLRTDWLDLDRVVKKGSVDLILGDIVSAQIRPALRKKFFEVVHSVLKPYGFFVARTKIFNPHWKEVSVEEILKLDMRVPSDPKAPFGSYFGYRLGDKILDLESETFNVGEFIPHLEHALPHAATRREHRYILALLKRYRHLSQVRTHHIKDRYENLVSHFFSIREKLYASDYPESDFFPFYVLQKIA